MLRPLIKRRILKYTATPAKIDIMSIAIDCGFISQIPSVIIPEENMLFAIKGRLRSNFRYLRVTIRVRMPRTP